MRLLFGAEFADSAPALPVLMATFVLVSVGYLAGYLIIAYGLQRRFLVIAVIALILNVAANLALVPSYGFMAAAWITLGTELIVRELDDRPRVPRDRRAAAVGERRAPGRWSPRRPAPPAGACGRRAPPVGVWTAAAALLYPALLLALRMCALDEIRALVQRDPR